MLAPPCISPPCIAYLSTDRISVVSGQHARLVVRGHGRGWLRVQGERRWVWGRFDEQFHVAVGRGTKAIDVILIGLGGHDRRSVVCDGSIVLEGSGVPSRPRVRSIGLASAVPVVRRVGARKFSGPRVARLELVAADEMHS